MDKNLLAYLEKSEISYKKYKHTPVFTVEESEKNAQIKKIPGLRTKSLFLKDENSNFYLICLPGKKRLNIKFLKQYLKTKDLNFSNPDELYQELQVKPGSVSLFSIIHAKKTKLIIDKEVWQAESAGFHPNINKYTFVLTHNSLKKFYDSLLCQKEIIELG
ncbi:MAG: YbaK/EbsC family protein [Nanoarchaeota archaeon]